MAGARINMEVAALSRTKEAEVIKAAAKAAAEDAAEDASAVPRSLP